MAALKTWFLDLIINNIVFNVCFIQIRIDNLDY